MNPLKPKHALSAMINKGTSIHLLKKRVESSSADGRKEIKEMRQDDNDDHSFECMGSDLDDDVATFHPEATKNYCLYPNIGIVHSPIKGRAAAAVGSPSSFALKPECATIWKGHFISKIIIKIANEGGPFAIHKNINAKTKCHFSAALENDTTGEVLDEGTTSDLVKFSFEMNNDSILNSQTNELGIDVHQDAVNPGDVLYVVVTTTEVDAGERQFFKRISCRARSPPIRVAEYALSVEEKFHTNPHVIYNGGNSFMWYNKCGGEYSCLDVAVHLRNSLGQICNALGVPLNATAALVYDNGSTPPVHVKNPLRVKNVKKVNTILYNPMRPMPRFEIGVASCPFSFRIEEVSKHHQSLGFRLKVAAATEEMASLVHPCLSDETIFVLSKPRANGRKTSVKPARKKSTKTGASKRYSGGRQNKRVANSK